MERPFSLRQGVSTLPHIVFQLGLSSRFGNKWNTQHGLISTLPVLHIPLCSVYDHTGWGCYTGPYTHDFWSNRALVLLNEELYQTGKLVLKSHLGLDTLTAIKGVVYTMLKNECCVFLLILLKIQPKSLLLWWEKTLHTELTGNSFWYSWVSLTKGRQTTLFIILLHIHL